MDSCWEQIPTRSILHRQTQDRIPDPDPEYPDTNTQQTTIPGPPARSEAAP